MRLLRAIRGDRSTTRRRKLHVVNGPLLNAKLADPATAGFASWPRARPDAARSSRNSTCGRSRGLPTAEEAGSTGEREFAAAGGTGRQRVLEDFAWSLLSCRGVRDESLDGSEW